jgi:hypothetical protein
LLLRFFVGALLTQHAAIFAVYIAVDFCHNLIKIKLNVARSNFKGFCERGVFASDTTYSLRRPTR